MGPDAASIRPQDLPHRCVVVSVNTLAPLWAGLEVRTCPALKRTHLTVYGAAMGGFWGLGFGVITNDD